MKRFLAALIFGIMVVALISIPDFSFAHGGGLAADGCHYNRRTGIRHCHRSPGFSPDKRSPGQPAKPKTKRMSEDDYNKMFCASVGGDTETRHEYPKDEEQDKYPKGYVKVDCETSDSVYEGGLDKRSSLDSLQQAVFFSVLTGKKPVVVIYDRDGKLGKYEYRIMKACEKVGVRFLRKQY